MHVHPSAALSAVALAACASTSGVASASCAPAGSTTLRSAGPARIYSRASKLYGCVGGRRTLLGSLTGTVPFPARRVVLHALGPGYAATDTVDMGVDTLDSTVTLVDLRTGATIATAPATTPENRPESFLTVTTLKVGAAPTVAWIGERSAIGQLKPVYEVHALLSTRNRLLATSSTRPTALHLQGNTLSWQTAGQTHTAKL